MGLFSSNDNEPVRPMSGIGRPLGVIEHFTRHQSEFTLKLREKKLSITGDDYEITTPDGRVFFVMKGKVFSLRSRKLLCDAQGHPIVNIQDKIFTFFKQFRIFPGEREEPEICHVKQHFKMIGEKLTVHFTNFDGQEVELLVKGSFIDKHAEIYLGDIPVARINRKFMNVGQILFDQQTYYLTVAPGVDIAMMTAVCVCLDEVANDKD
ncbi:hypothetical protein GLOTRDRAFT_59241 [Gloeophyllum trabeum ATCC 11539]|uniref:DUF567-domain-containing protein n=1 Tax=Gloeophyllum trabeum (strain ATCC 11539 / FP-39264 / Madison 617) TaxID=670483 RepID=S7RSU7_GLOTA|nr:uncharacterized protein GLOTRDRAFT_59241 [Gloeophyllum trabeum ATCC 11539]EPQ56144.1 hypothetical protein GLOTRDRAFT_59241 [Gloeophyllum trabeum ATCC 11539]